MSARYERGAARRARRGPARDGSWKYSRMQHNSITAGKRDEPRGHEKWWKLKKNPNPNSLMRDLRCIRCHIHAREGHANTCNSRFYVRSFADRCYARYVPRYYFQSRCHTHVLDERLKLHTILDMIHFVRIHIFKKLLYIVIVCVYKIVRDWACIKLYDKFYNFITCNVYNDKIIMLTYIYRNVLYQFSLKEKKRLRKPLRYIL